MLDKKLKNMEMRIVVENLMNNKCQNFNLFKIKDKQGLGDSWVDWESSNKSKIKVAQIFKNDYWSFYFKI